MKWGFVNPQEGEEVSTLEVKNILKDIIARENKKKPHSDEKLKDVVAKVAGPMIEKMASQMLEKIAWEVVPDLAEAMIKEEIRKIKDGE